MAEYSPLLGQLIDALKFLPGVGQKSAQRMAFHLLQGNRQKALQLGEVLKVSAEKLNHCQQCRTYTEKTLCPVCENPQRKREQLCIVENPSDVLAIESGTNYKGVYYVLMGRLSPLDGIGPEEIGLDKLEARLDEGEVEELILATNSTVEGEVTAHVISEMAKKRSIQTTRLAQGVPIGGELEYIDLNTLNQAFDARTKY